MSGKMNGLELRIRMAGEEEGFDDSNMAQLNCRMRDWLIARGEKRKEFNPCFGKGKRMRKAKKTGGETE
jgi:hypothetical protein